MASIATYNYIAPRRYYDYDYAASALYSPYWPRYFYNPGFESCSYGFERRDPSLWDEYVLKKPFSTERDFKSYLDSRSYGFGRRDPSLWAEYIPKKPFSTVPKSQSYLDRYKLSNDLYWERRYNNFKSRQQNYFWDHKRSLLPTKLSPFDQVHIYGAFR